MILAYCADKVCDPIFELLVLLSQSAALLHRRIALPAKRSRLVSGGSKSGSQRVELAQDGRKFGGIDG